jgi:hypothetical protein
MSKHILHSASCDRYLARDIERDASTGDCGRPCLCCVASNDGSVRFEHRNIVYAALTRQYCGEVMIDWRKDKRISESIADEIHFHVPSACCRWHDR